MTDARAAQTALRALVASPGDARSAQVAARVLVQTKTQSNLAGFSVDVATKPSPESRLAGLSTDVAVVATPENRLAGLSLDIAVPTYTSIEPTDTAYTTAVKADLPLAYWRLEDGSDSTRVYDSAVRSVYTNQTPGTSAPSGGASYTFGADFTSTTNGVIAGIRFYRSASATETSRTLRLWTSGGTQIASAVTSGESGSGWKTAMFAIPVPYTTGTTVVATLDLGPSSSLAYTTGGGATPIVNGILTRGQTRLANASGTFPGITSTDTHFVDILFSNAYPGTRVGGNDVWSPVDSGRAIAFTGVTGEGVDCGASNIVGTGLSAMSLECWFKTTLTTSPQILIAARDFGGATGNNNYETYINNGKPQVSFYCASGFRSVVGSTNRNDGNWHHLVGTYDGATGTVRLYIDGVEEAPSPTTGAVIGNVNSGGGTRLKLVNYLWNNTTTAISIDEAAIYGAALSATRVSAHYAARLATATQAQTSRESLRVATQTVGAAQVSRESLRVATQTVGAAQVSRESLRVAIQAPGGVVGLYHQAVQAVVSTADVALYHQAVQAVVQFGAPAVPGPTGPSWSVWNGTAEVPATATVWNGTAEIATTTEIAP